MKTETKWQHWHAHIGQQLNVAMTTASKYINVVQKFFHRDPLLEACSTCIIAKQTENTATGTTLQATVPFQGFSHSSVIVNIL